jgi:8-oxo-dGTP pyrophosphatase MutT (NUDIX family)
MEQTALREVEEETGLQVRILGPLPSISYAFVQDGKRIHKTVHYWLMEPVAGDLARHDREFERVRWVPLAEAANLLTFATERALVGTAAASLIDPSTTPEHVAAGAAAHQTESSSR